MVRRNSAAGGKMLWLDPIRCGCAAAGSFLVGTWLSLVEHSLGVRGVGSSNLPVPTIQILNIPKRQREGSKNCRPTKHPNLSSAAAADDTHRDCEGCEATPSHSA